MFEPSLQIDNPKDDDEEIKNGRVEGVRLTLMTPTNNGRTLQEAFTGYAMMFVKRHNFTLFMAHLPNRTYGPEWFTREFPTPLADQEVESLKYGRRSHPTITLNPVKVSKERIKYYVTHPTSYLINLNLTNSCPNPSSIERMDFVSTTSTSLRTSITLGSKFS